jgi:hypothetical protein
VGQPNPFASQLQQVFNQNDPAAYPPMSLYPNGYNAPPVTQAGQQPGLNQPGFNQPGFNPGINQPGLNQPGINQPGFNPGLNQAGLNQAGLNQNQPGLNPNLPGGLPQNVQLQNGQPFPGQQIPGQSPAGGLPGGYVPGGQTPPGINPNFPNQFPVNSDPNNPGANQFQNFQQGFSPTPVPGTNVTPNGGQPNQAINLINQLLTTPRQPPPGLGLPTTQPTTTGVGLAGVASSYTGPTIKAYGDRTRFEEWEFVFQPKTGVVGGAGQPPPNIQGGPNNSAGGMNQNGLNNQPGTNNPSGINPQPNFNNVTGLPQGTAPPQGLPPGVILTP